MKKIVSLLLVSAFVLCAAACEGRTEQPVPTSSGRVVIETPPQPETPTPFPTAAPAPVSSAEAETTPDPFAQAPVETEEPRPEDPYADIIALYAKAVSEAWDVETCYNNNVNYLVALARNYGTIGYCLRDVDSSGKPELFFGCVGSKEIYAGYTLMGGKPSQFLDAGERSSYYLEPDDVFVNVCSNSAFQGGCRIVHLSGDSLVLNVAMIYDFTYSETEPWFLSNDDDWDITNDSKMSTAAAQKAEKAYQDNYVALPYEPLVG